MMQQIKIEEQVVLEVITCNMKLRIVSLMMDTEKQMLTVYG